MNLDTDIARYTELLQNLLASPRRPFDNNLRARLPTTGGVYRILETDSDGQATIYIGQSTNLQNRIYRSHLMGNRQVSTLKRKLIESGQCADEQAVKQYLREKCLVQFVTVEDGVERIAFEHFAVAVLAPTFND